MKLFAVYVGGRAKGANIEVHDMRFIVAETIGKTYAALRRQWWGLPETLHLDAWAELSQADGYAVTLKPEPSTGAEKLYYVNLGGYEHGNFTELHHNMFVVAESEQKAKRKALAQVRHWDAPHKDDLYEAEECFCLNDVLGDVAAGQGLHIHLQHNGGDAYPPFECRYVKIGKAIKD